MTLVEIEFVATSVAIAMQRRRVNNQVSALRDSVFAKDLEAGSQGLFFNTCQQASFANYLPDFWRIRLRIGLLELLGRM